MIPQCGRSKFKLLGSSDKGSSQLNSETSEWEVCASQSQTYCLYRGHAKWIGGEIFTTKLAYLCSSLLLYQWSDASRELSVKRAFQPSATELLLV